MTSFRKVFRRGLYVLAIFLVLSLIFTLGYYTLAGTKQSKRYANAIRLAEQGDLAQAELLLRRVLQDDRNNENALVKLAEIHEKMQRYHKSAACWHLACGLNKFEPKYVKSEIQNLLRCRDFLLTVYVIENLPASAKKQFHAELCLAKLRTGKIDDAKKAFELSTSSSSPLSEYLQHIFSASTPNRNWQGYMSSSDIIVATDAMLQQFFQYRNSNRLAEAEVVIRKLADKNPEVGAPLAGDFFYLDLKRLPAAGAMYSRARQYTLSLPRAIRYAEVLFLTKQADELQKIAAEYRKGSKKILLAGFYMDSLHAFLINDKKQLQQSLSALENVPLPVLGQSILLNYGIENENFDMICRALKEMSRSGLLPQAASALTAQVAPLLRKQYNAGNIAAVYPIAALLLSEHNPDLLLTRIVIMAKNTSGELTPPELSGAMRRFPNDPLLSNIAAVNAIAQGNYREAIRLTSGISKDHPAVRDLFFLRIVAMEGLGELDHAITVYQTLLKQFPGDVGIHKQFLAFVMRHRRVAVLDQFAMPAILEPFIKAEQYYQRGEMDKAKPLWSKQNIAGRLNPSELDDRPLLFQIATRLATTGESTRAIELYRKLLQHMPDNPLILVNLSELYATVGQKDSAMQTAQIAKNKYPAISEVQLCYGLRLFDAKNYNLALNELEPHLKNPRARSAAIASMEILVEDYYTKKQYVLCEELCNRLLKLSPANPLAKKYLANIAERRKQRQ